MRKLYQREGVNLEDLISFPGGRYFLYKINGVYYPNETLHNEVSQSQLVAKARNESLFFYQPKPGDTVIDLGAGLGEEAVILSSLVGNNGFIICVEANPGAFAVLSAMIRKNGLKNVTAICAAIAPSDGKVFLQPGNGSYESGFLTNKNISAIEVDGIIVDSLFTRFNLQSVALLKANIEGAERFLVTMNKEHLAKVENVAIACHDFRLRKEPNDFFRTREMISRMLEENGFEVQTRSTGVDYLDDWVYGRNKHIL